MLPINNKKKHKIFFVIYCCFIFSVTVLFRKPDDHRTLILGLFWSYRAWIAGESYGLKESIQNIGNVLFFVPFGYLCTAMKSRLILTVISALAFSVFIELIQYIFALGWCELDDVICNTLGALFGYWLYVKTQRIGNCDEA